MGVACVCCMCVRVAVCVLQCMGVACVCCMCVRVAVCVLQCMGVACVCCMCVRVCALRTPKEKLPSGVPKIEFSRMILE